MKQLSRIVFNNQNSVNLCNKTEANASINMVTVMAQLHFSPESVFTYLGSVRVTV